MPPAFVHRITKYDPDDRDEDGSYRGAEEAVSDHGPVEAAYLEAISAFAHATGTAHLEIREPSITGPVYFGAQPASPDHGLGGLFPEGLTGYHDGAEVSLEVALELVRVMLREQGAWCRLEAGDVFTVHVGWDQYVYVGSDHPCTNAVARTRELGLFAEPLTVSPYAAKPEVTEVADEAFWDAVRTELRQRQRLLLEETAVVNRRHLLTAENLDAVRAGLAPRALLYIWPDLQPDVGAVLAALPTQDTVEFVWETKDGAIHSLMVDEAEYAELAALVADARSACALPPAADEHPPLLQAALPDSDGVLRARW